MTQRIIGLAIEGFGFDTSKELGVALHNSQLTPSDESGYAWRAALASPVPRLRYAINPFTGEWSAPSLRVEVSRTDALAQALMFTPRETPLALGAALAQGATSVASTGIGPGLDNQVIWLGDEALLLGTRVGSVYPCTRGFWSTPEQDHPEGTLVYTSQAYWYRRRVRVVEHDLATGIDSVLWQGLLESVRMVNARLEIEAVSLLAAGRRARLNRDARQLNPGTITRRGRAVSNTVRVDYGARVRRAFSPGDTIQTFQVGESSVGFAALREGVGSISLADIQPLTGPLDVAFDEQFDGDIYQIFAVDRDFDERDGAGLGLTQDLPQPHHPLAIALALLVSTGEGSNGPYDVFGPTWGLGIDYIDLSSFTDLIALRPDDKIDVLVLGFGGEDVDPFETIEQQLLRPFGYYLTLSATGALACARLRLPDLEAFSEANARALSAYLDAPVVNDRRLGERAQTVVATVGGPPNGDPSTITVRVPDRSRRAGRLQDGPRVTYDYRVIRAERLTNEGRDVASLSNALVQILALGLDAAPILRFRCASSRATSNGLIVGAYARVQDLGSVAPWYVGGDGSLLSLSDNDVRAYGLVISLDLDAEGDAMDVELLMLGWRLEGFVRNRAPAGIVASWSPNDVVLEPDNFNTPSGDDASAFAADDEVALWTSDGVLRSTTYPSVLLVGANTLTLTGGFGAATPEEGDVIRIAPSPTFDNASRFPGIRQPFAYIGDDAGEFTDVDGITRSDVYGTEVFSGNGGTVTTDPPYLGLDDAAIEAVSGEAQPLDTWLEHTWRQNESRLLQFGSQAAHPTLAPHGGDYLSFLGHRPFCSINPSTVLIVPMLLPPGLEAVRLAFVGRVATGSSTGSDQSNASVGVRLQLLAPDGGVLADESQTLDSTMLLTPQWQSFKVDAELARPLGQSTLVRAVLWITSDRSEEVKEGSSSWAIGTDTPTLGRVGSGVWVTNPATFWDDTVAPRPNSAGLDTRAVALDATAFSGTQPYDLISVGNFTLGQTGYLYPRPPGAYALEQFDITFLQARGFEWWLRFADTTAHPDALIAPNVPLLGEVVSQHATRTDAAYLRPRLLWGGPSGQIPGAPYPDGYTERFARTDHGASETVLASALVRPMTESPRLRMLFDTLSTWCVNTPLQVPSDQTDTAVVASWLLRLRVYQPDSTGWVEVFTSLTTLARVHWLTYTEQAGVLLGELLSFEGEYPFKEGQLFDGELGYLQTGLIEVELDGYSAREPETPPLRVDLTLEGTGAPEWPGGLFRSPLASQNRQIPARLRCALTGATLWEVAQ